MTRSHFNTNVPYLEFPWSATFHWKLMTSDHDIFKMFDGILKMAPLCIMLEDRPIWKQRVHAQVLLFYWSQAMHVALHLRQLFWKCCSCCVIYWAMHLCKSNISFQVSILFSCITSVHPFFLWGEARNIAKGKGTTDPGVNYFNQLLWFCLVGLV